MKGQPDVRDEHRWCDWESCAELRESFDALRAARDGGRKITITIMEVDQLTPERWRTADAVMACLHPGLVAVYRAVDEVDDDANVGLTHEARLRWED